MAYVIGQQIMTIYIAAVGLEKLTYAQNTIESHLLECMACSSNQPCPERKDAEEVFSRCGRLPRRKPGLAGGAALTHVRFDGFKQGT